MAKTIELTDLIINYLHVDYMAQCVRVSYNLRDAAGKTWSQGEAVFWVNIPDPGTGFDGSPNQIPDNWFQLPSGYIATLIQLRNDADQALTNKFLV